MIHNIALPIFRVLVLCLAGVAAGATAGAADIWVNADDPGVITNNDCGFVAAIHHAAVIRRSFLAEGDAGMAANIADRVTSGDILQTPDGGRVEIASGNNVALVLGPASRLKLGGMRSFTDAAGLAATRLDVEILAGDVRVQVRLNREAPEYVLITAEGADVLVSRGDVAVTTGDGWLASTLSGTAGGRVHRGKVVGAPFAIESGTAVGNGGAAALTGAASDALRGRLPFSFEVEGLALPPLPPQSWELEAP